ncbi:MAG: transcriptional regulator [Firmicutes bacterium HGW-Firmicutes-14]|nr:MAG: transcriptional regulator [Firmicutes bacterium HGW-Firmicutes-14]
MKSRKFNNVKNSDSVVPARIREARISRGYTLAELSDLIGVSSQAISQYELGASIPSMTVLVKMMEVLDFPLNFFTKPKRKIDYSSSAVNFRSMKSTAKKLKDAFAYRIDWADEIYQYLKRYIDFPKVDLPNLDSILNNTDLDYDTIEEVALSIRKFWGIEKIPIRNMVELLQEKGFVICNVEFKNHKMDAFSQWYNNVPYIVMGSDKRSASRSRFDLAHELGHLILHPHIDQETMQKKEVLDKLEDEAHYFAGAFLLPSNSFPSEVISNSLEHLTLLKKRWKVSIQAMIMRCEKLGLFKENQVRYLFAQINKKGYRKQEPLDDVIPIEKPYLIKQAFELLLDNNVVSAEEILDEFALNKDEIDNLCFLPSDLLSTHFKRPKLALITD